MIINRFWNRSIKILKPSFSPIAVHHAQPFTSSSLHPSSSSRTPPRRRTDHQITSEWIQLVDPSCVLNSSPNSADQPTTNSLLKPSRTLDVLSRLDFTQYALIEVNGITTPPICKLINRSDLTPVTRVRRSSKPTHKSLPIKEIQINNQIEPNDLSTKFRTAIHALQKGHRIRISIILNPNGPINFSDLIEERLMEIGAEKIKQEREGKKLFMDWSPGKVKKKS
ncbi:uncharacterized protein MELLADRAFT_66481 [Melampsora larici-populina 98AG31]|uniref:Translation initiation factor 3 N-terminal domain-containing protein n=1 Tax=Melampsora larici-populina (strain 98AG31 / pathotype 3-4-7) TaxID=747676 RepID=F4RZD2_MELLP|nr:uncharacterized protein MELLADRAFT_66481 [Melampsora larici-populina 98AG31]EGG02275.1 hypothetical protein MELLADRAFT_66481 [Melampsora larici-populina 98AG31]